MEPRHGNTMPFLTSALQNYRVLTWEGLREKKTESNSREGIRMMRRFYGSISEISSNLD